MPDCRSVTKFARWASAPHESFAYVETTTASGGLRVTMTSLDLDLLRQTPQSVWDEYAANGYTILRALRMEQSYA